MAKRFAKLTDEENQLWEKYFSWYVDDGRTEEEAAKLAWADLQREFPRLKEYDGAEP